MKQVGWYSTWHAIIIIVFHRIGIDTCTLKIPVQQKDFRMFSEASFLI